MTAITLRSSGKFVALILPLVAGVACGSKTPGGTGPTATSPEMTCPAAMVVRGILGPSLPLTYTAPVVTGGQAPVTVTCAPASGASFPIGTTQVSCTATDALSRQARCAFDVTLTGVALGVTKYGTFGDSLTEGEMGRPSAVPLDIDPLNTYPVLLQSAFDRTYPGQGITVINRGHSGDNVDVTLAAITRWLPVDRPGAVLLLTGFNNLTGPCSPGQAGTAACIDAIQSKVPIGVRDCIREIKESPVGVKYVFVSTLTPPGASGSNRIDPAAILQANNRIRQIVAQEGVILVDTHSTFVGHESEYVNVDGLHLRAAGYQALADAFFAAIQAAVPQTPQSFR